MKTDTIKLYIPEFTLDAPDHDKIWCTFWWMIGQNWGFDQMYQFYIDDYQILTPPGHAGSNRGLTVRFTRNYSKWISMGSGSTQNIGIIRFGDLNWSFVPWECENPRTQRLWVHLYNAVWCGKELRQDLFKKENKKDAYRVMPLHTDIDWWNSNHGVRPQDHIPHYLRIPPTIGKYTTPPFAGKIKLEINE